MEDAFKNPKRYYYYSYSASNFTISNLSVSTFVWLGCIYKYHYTLDTRKKNSFTRHSKCVHWDTSYSIQLEVFSYSFNPNETLSFLCICLRFDFDFWILFHHWTNSYRDMSHHCFSFTTDFCGKKRDSLG